MLKKFYRRMYLWYQDNSFAALEPEQWANRGLRKLREVTTMLPLVNRDYDDAFAKFGDVVNLHTIGSTATTRKRKGQPVSVQAVAATGMTAKLNQHLTNAIYLDENDIQKSFVDLAAQYMPEQMISMANTIDVILAGEMYKFYGRTAGKLGSAITDSGTILGANELFTRAGIPPNFRSLVVGPSGESDLLDEPRFVEAYKFGSAVPLLTGQIGKIRGFDTMVGTQIPEVPTGSDIVTGAVNNGSGYAAGTTTIAVDGLSAAITAGTWFTVESDMTPQRVVSTVGGATPTAITFEPGFTHAVADDDVVTLYDPGQVNLPGSSYAADWGDPIAVDNFSTAPFVGQGVSFGASGDPYMIIAVGSGTITLNRPLDAITADGVTVNLMPAGNYNLAFIPDAITFVNRPQRAIAAGTGASSAFVNYNGIALRVTITWDADYLGYRILFDTLCGVQTLNTTMGCLVCG